MQIDQFELERIQSLYENTVEINLSDSGVHPYSLRQLLTKPELEGLLDLNLGYGWTNGTPALRETIAALYPGARAENVVVTNGSAEAIFVMGMAVLSPGDEMIVVIPNYLALPGWAKAIGAGVKTVSLRPELGWLPDPAEIEAAITPRTRLLSVCNPNNPTGRVLPIALMRELVEICRRHGLYLHADEVYRGSEFEGPETTSFADLYEKTLVTSGVSKTIALPGLRIGWLLGPADVIADAWHRKDYTSITTTKLSEYVATIALKPARRQQILQRTRQHLTQNLAAFETWIAQNGNHFSHIRPEATGMVFMRYHFEQNSTDFVHELRLARKVLLLPGDVYGLDGYLRVGIGMDTAELVDGLSRLSDHVGR